MRTIAVRRFTGAFCLAILALTVPTAVAQTVRTWDGDGGDGLWSTAANWSGDVLPASGDEIRIAGAAVVHLDASFVLDGKIFVGEAFDGATTELIVDSGVTLTVNRSGPGLVVERNVFVTRTDRLVNHGSIVAPGLGGYYLDIDGELENFGVIRWMTVDVSGSNARFTNHGQMLDRASIIVQPNAVFDNHGTVDQGILQVRHATATNHTGATFHASGGFVHIQEEGVLDNYGSLFNTRTFTNSGLVVNHGLFDNTGGTVRNTCAVLSLQEEFEIGIFTNLGTYVGPAPTEECKVWDNDSGNSLWSDPTNWSLDTLPDADDIVIISGLGTVMADLAFTQSFPGQIVVSHPTALSGLDVRPGVPFSAQELTVGRNATVTTRMSSTLSAWQLDVFFDGSLVNFGTLRVRGLLHLGQDAVIENRALVENEGTIELSAGTFISSGTFHNDGHFESLCASSAVIEITGPFTGAGTRALCSEWTGFGGDGLWSTPANWTFGLPQLLDEVSITGAAEVHLDVSYTSEGKIFVGDAFDGAQSILIVDGGATLNIDRSGPGLVVERNVFVTRTDRLVNHGNIVAPGLGGYYLDIDGELESFGVIRWMTVDVSGSNARFTNHGQMLDRASIIVQPNAVFDNHGTVDQGILQVRHATATNHAGATFHASGAFVHIHEEGVLDNYGTFINTRTFTNENQVFNSGLLDTSGGTFNNDGQLTIRCGGVLTGTVNGNPPIEEPCDTTPPVVTVPDDLTREAISPAGAIVTFEATALDDVDGPLDPSCSHLSGATFPLGRTEVTCTATDAAGNEGMASFFVDVVDTTPPVISAVRSPDANGAGWNNSAVSVDFSCSDFVSGIAVEPVDVVLAGQGADQTAMATCQDGAGNEASKTVEGISIDLTPPELTAMRSPAANVHGWNNTDVAVNFTCIDALSGVAVGPIDVVVSSEGANQSASGSCRDVADNAAETTIDGISIDRTVPIVTGTPDRAPDSNGWYNHAFSVSWSGADVLSGVVSCSAPAAWAGPDTGAGLLGGSCTDHADNAGEGAFPFLYDATPPSIAIAQPTHGGAYTLHQWIESEYACTDALSGMVSCNGPVASGSAFDTSFVGSHEFAVHALDAAGNAAVVSHEYAVHYLFQGFFPPLANLPEINRGPAGRTFPVRFGLRDANGAMIADRASIAALVLVAQQCGAGAPGDETPLDSSRLRYDPNAGIWHFNWKSSKGQAGCWTFEVRLDDGTAHGVGFELR